MMAKPALPTQSRRTTLWIAMVVVFVMGAALRAPGLFSDFWLDEIWSLNIARSAHSLKDLLLSAAARIDNNHPLNTLFLYLIGDVRAEWIYRIAAFVAGIGSIAAAARALRERGRLEAFCAAALVAMSFPLVFYASEARGYALASFFTLLALDAMLRFVAKPQAVAAVAFNLACILGFLSHLTFMHFYLAAMFWTFFALRSASRSLRQRLTSWAQLNALPILFLLILYRVFIRHIVIGGARETSSIVVLIKSLSMPLGGPATGSVAMVFAMAAAIAFIASLICLARRGDQLWLFYLLAVLVAPALLVLYDLKISARPQPLMLRYFLVALTMMLMAMAQGFAALLRSSDAPARASAVLLAAIFIIGNVAQISHFLEHGRGGYSAALARMLSVSSDREVTIGANAVFRTKLPIQYYARRMLPPGRGIDLYPDDYRATRAHPPEWYIDDSETSSPATTIIPPDGTVYQLDSFYPAGELSGLPWALYRIDIPATLRRNAS